MKATTSREHSNSVAGVPMADDVERREPRCRVCQDETVRIVVNELLDWRGVPVFRQGGKSHRITLKEIHKWLEPLNEGREKSDRITYDSDTNNGEVWTDTELTASLAEEIDGLGDENFLKQDVELRGDAAIRDYIVECALVGIYKRVDDGESTAYRRTLDGQMFYAAEMEDVYLEDVGNLSSEAREEATFNRWLDDVLLHGVFTAIDADSASIR